MVIKGLKKLCNAAVVNVFCFCFMMQKIIDIQSGALLCKNSGELCETDNCECSPPDRKSGVLSEFLESRTLKICFLLFGFGQVVHLETFRECVCN